ncbi:conserved hypothetical protein [Desulfamplus magnetovallimortis]|uniref:Uncharacterized protein n=1 Tax=Desulfamplus magnetovallimortis TaxID=1246637 RepID=A0A1W1H9C4_9BACT|nr:hypothetical protein [Desulfamplus magnetovallimortis]SLM29053.1 conserved hypothetical protein [Desulfamplus magnetovallimortis]
MNTKTTKIKDQWLYVVIQDPGTSSEELMGFATDSIPTPFIPAFETKEEAQQCFLLMPKDLMNKKYEVQAIIKEDLIEHAKSNGHKVYLIDHKSSIKNEIM